MSYKEWLDKDVLEDYLKGKLDAKTMHQIEKLSLEDPFVAEALTGLRESPRRNQALSLLQKQLQQRIAQKPLEQKSWRITSHRLSIASAAAVLCIALSVLFWMKASKRQELLAKQAKKVEVTMVSPPIVKKINRPQNLAQPVKGWKAYQLYLKENNRFTKNGAINQVVELSFTINQQGVPTQIKIVKSAGKKHDDEALRLLRDGPKWRYKAKAVNHGKLNLSF